MSNCNHTRDQSSLHGDECAQCLHDKIAHAKAELAHAKSDAATWNKSFHDANTERLALKAKYESLQRHHDLCRAEAGAPGDDVLLESIKALKADLAAARAEYGKMVVVCDELRSECARLRAALERIADGYNDAGHVARSALATPSAEPTTLAPVVPIADAEALRAAYSKRVKEINELLLRHDTIRRDAEALAKALEALAVRARYHVDCQPARIAIAAYRSRHPALKE